MPVDSNNGERASKVARAFGLKGRYHQLVDEVVSPVIVVATLDDDETPPAFGTPPGTDGGSGSVIMRDTVAGEAGLVAITAGSVPIRLVQINIPDGISIYGVFDGLIGSGVGGAVGYWRAIRPGTPAARVTSRTATLGNALAEPLLVIPPSYNAPVTNVDISIPAFGSVSIVPIEMGSSQTAWEVIGSQPSATPATLVWVE